MHRSRGGLAAVAAHREPHDRNDDPGRRDRDGECHDEVRGAGEAHGGGTGTRVATLDPAATRDLRRSLAHATDAVDFGDVPVADIPSTQTRVHFRGRIIRANVNALDFDTGLTTAQRHARERLSRVIESAAQVPNSAYEPATYEVGLIVFDDPSIQLEWPGPALPTGTCGTLTSAEYDQFPGGFQQGNAYTSGGRTFSLWLRPLRPGEQACRNSIG